MKIPENLNDLKDIRNFMEENNINSIEIKSSLERKNSNEATLCISHGLVTYSIVVNGRHYSFRAPFNKLDEILFNFRGFISDCEYNQEERWE